MTPQRRKTERRSRETAPRPERRVTARKTSDDP
jgi:hypothetical protein